MFEAYLPLTVVVLIALALGAMLLISKVQE